MIKVLFKRVGYSTMVKCIPNTLEAFQGLVGGYIETVGGLGGDLVLVVNEEGKLKGLDPHLLTENYDVLVGDVIVTAYDGEGDFRDLTDEEITTAIEILEEMEL